LIEDLALSMGCGDVSDLMGKISLLGPVMANDKGHNGSSSFKVHAEASDPLNHESKKSL
jgi:hypothetical protein